MGARKHLRVHIPQGSSPIPTVCDLRCELGQVARYLAFSIWARTLPKEHAPAGPRRAVRAIEGNLYMPNPHPDTERLQKAPSVIPAGSTCRKSRRASCESLSEPSNESAECSSVTSMHQGLAASSCSVLVRRVSIPLSKMSTSEGCQRRRLNLCEVLRTPTRFTLIVHCGPAPRPHKAQIKHRSDVLPH